MLFACSTVLQQGAASSVPTAEAGPVRLLVRLVRHPRWLAGRALDTAATLTQALALRTGSIIVVQVLAVTGVPTALLLSARIERRRLAPDERLAAATVLGGVALLLVAAPNQTGRPASARALTILFVLIAFGGAAMLRAGTRAWAFGAAAGVTFTVGSAFLKAAAGGWGRSGPIRMAVLLPGVGFLAIALIGNAIVHQGFHRAPLARSLPALTAAEPVTALALGTLVYGISLFDHPVRMVVVTLGVVIIIGGLLASGSLDRSAAYPARTRR
jgi:hypothetical protein